MLAMVSVGEAEVEGDQSDLGKRLRIDRRQWQVWASTATVDRLRRGAGQSHFSRINKRIDGSELYI